MLFTYDGITFRAIQSMESFCLLTCSTILIFIIVIRIVVLLLILPIGLNKNNRFMLIPEVWAFSLPSIIIIIMLIPSLRPVYTGRNIFLSSISVIGSQWFWSYKINSEIFESYLLPIKYADSFFPLLSDFILHIPLQLPIITYITSTDVIHSWTIPRIGVKIDAIPGHITTSQFSTLIPGNYSGQCSELCGAYHSFMPISINVI